MPRTLHAAARSCWAAAFLFFAGSLAACTGSGDAEEGDRPAVSYESVAALQAEAATRFLTTDAALAEVETAVSALDSTGQATSRPFVERLRATRARLQSELDSLNAERFPSREAFDTLAVNIRDRLDALDASIARDRVLVIPEAAALRAFASVRLGTLAERAERLRADSTREGMRSAAEMDSARVRLERQVALLGGRNVRYDSLRDVLAAGFSGLQRFQRDTLALRFRPDSLR